MRARLRTSNFEEWLWTCGQYTLLWVLGHSCMLTYLWQVQRQWTESCPATWTSHLCISAAYLFMPINFSYQYDSFGCCQTARLPSYWDLQRSHCSLSLELKLVGSSSSSPPVGSSNIFGCSPKGSSQPLKKREGWLFEAMWVSDKNFPKLSLFLWHERSVFVLFCVFSQALIIIAELKFQTEWKLTD